MFLFFFSNLLLSAEIADKQLRYKVAHTVPNAQQMTFHKEEFKAFIHFNMNTFTHKQWGTGKERPEEFNPTSIDTDQWARVIKEAGMTSFVLTAKHHDGFCLWPTSTTSHSVKNSAWKNGPKFGIYFSPADGNHPSYGTMDYYPVMLKKITELLSNYGEIHDVWMDHAVPPEMAKKHQPGFNPWSLDINELVKKLQPQAMFVPIDATLEGVKGEDGVVKETLFFPAQQGNEFFWKNSEAVTSIRHFTKHIPYASF